MLEQSASVVPVKQGHVSKPRRPAAEPRHSRDALVYLRRSGRQSLGLHWRLPMLAILKCVSSASACWPQTPKATIAAKAANINIRIFVIVKPIPPVELRMAGAKPLDASP